MNTAVCSGDSQAVCEDFTASSSLVERAAGNGRHEQPCVDPHQHPLRQQGGDHRRQPAGLSGRPVQRLQRTRVMHLQRAR